MKLGQFLFLLFLFSFVFLSLSNATELPPETDAPTATVHGQIVAQKDFPCYDEGPVEKPPLSSSNEDANNEPFASSTDQPLECKKDKIYMTTDRFTDLQRSKIKVFDLGDLSDFDDHSVAVSGLPLRATFFRFQPFFRMRRSGLRVSLRPIFDDDSIEGQEAFIHTFFNGFVTNRPYSARQVMKYQLLKNFATVKHDFFASYHLSKKQATRLMLNVEKCREAGFWEAFVIVYRIPYPNWLNHRIQIRITPVGLLFSPIERLSVTSSPIRISSSIEEPLPNGEHPLMDVYSKTEKGVFRPILPKMLPWGVTYTPYPVVSQFVYQWLGMA
jgi:hypothetical protein